MFSDVDLMEYLNTRQFGLAKLSVYVEKDLDLILNQFRGLFKNYEVMATSKDYIEITRKGTNKWENLVSFTCRRCNFYWRWRK